MQENNKIGSIPRPVFFALLELAVAVLIAVIAFYTIKNSQDSILAASLIGAMGLTHGLHRIISSNETKDTVAHASDYMSKIESKMSNIEENVLNNLDISNQTLSSSIGTISKKVDVSEFANLYWKIDTEFSRDRELILQDAKRKLNDLDRSKESQDFKKGEYYTWIRENMIRVGEGDRVLAISKMMDSEWDDSNAERAFFNLNKNVAAAGAIVERIFVMDRDTYESSKSMPVPDDEEAVNARVVLDAHSEGGLERLIGYFVDAERLMAEDEGLYDKIGDGFLMFHFGKSNDRVAMIDDFDDDGNARGTVTKRDSTISSLRQSFENLKNFGSQKRMG